MTDEQLPNGDHNASSLLVQIDALCDQFDAALKAGQSPKIEQYLARASESQREALFKRLLALEIDHRRQHGELPTENVPAEVGDNTSSKFERDAEIVLIQLLSDMELGDHVVDPRATAQKERQLPIHRALSFVVHSDAKSSQQSQVVGCIVNTHPSVRHSIGVRPVSPDLET